jgi:Cu(I)-responsive transcriptional regulator
MNIGEAARQSGLSARMIRHYESLGLMPQAPRRDGGYRDYGSDDLERLRFIRRARDLGFPLPEIASLIELWQDPARASAAVKALALQRVAALKAQAREIDAMRASLEALAGDCPGDAGPTCPILAGLARG